MAWKMKDITSGINVLSSSSNLKDEVNTKCEILQFLKWPLEAGTKKKSICIDPRIKMPNFPAEINMFTAWCRNGFGLYI